MTDPDDRRVASDAVVKLWLMLLVAGALLFGASGCGDRCDGVECERGVCQEGECVDSQRCFVDRECLAGRRCRSDGVCVPDPCDGVDCGDDAECDPVSGQCRKLRRCTSRTGGDVCADDERCVDGVCRPDAEAICDELDCQRGVCDARFRECVNARRCESNDDCLPDFVCTADDSCVARSEACDALDCPGNTTCEYRSEERELVCAENQSEACRTSFDCLEDRRCAGDQCVEPNDCEQDAHEPNDSVAEATPVRMRAEGMYAEAMLCGEDVDHFSFDLDDIDDSQLRGTAYVTAHISERDIGLGRLELEVFDREGRSLGADVAGKSADDDTALVEVSVDAASPREYTARIAADGELNRAGLAYTAGAQFLDRAGAEACESPEELQSGETVTADTADASAQRLGSSCTDPTNRSRDQVYRFDVDQTSLATIELDPEDGDDDFSLSLRESCERAESELACVDLYEKGTERLERALGEGSYDLIVQSPDPSDDDGLYDLSLDLEPTDCAESSSYCVDEETASECLFDEGRFEERDCSEGCDPRTGRCAPPEGDTCSNPIALADGDSVSIDWSSLDNDYVMPEDSCVYNGRRTHTSGPDAVFEVELEPDHAFEAELKLADGQRGSLYLLSSCVSPASSCVSGANERTLADETMVFFNDSDQKKRYRLVADLAADSDEGEATLEYRTREVVCEPTKRRCTDDDQVERCTDLGSGYEVVETCEFGCESGACEEPPHDTCEAPKKLDDGESVTEPIEPFSNDFAYNPPSEGCTSQSVLGADAVYSVETTQPGQRVRIEVDAPWEVAITAARDCHVDQARCLKASDEGTSPEVLEFTARRAGEYFIIVDATETDQQGEFTVSADIDTPSCSPGEVLGCDGDSVEYCDASGDLQTYACEDGCSDGVCNAPGGDTCADPVVLSDGDSVTESLGGSDAVTMPPRRFGRCALDQLDRTRGPDDIYRVDLEAGELLEADLSTDADDTFMFLAEDCFFADETCTDNNTVGGESTLYHHAESDGSVYVIVDSDSSSTNSQYTLDVDVSQGSECAPDRTRCVDGDTVERCAADGDSVLANYSCPTACTGGECFTDHSVVDGCGGAPDVGDGISIFADRHRLTDALTMPATYSCIDEYGNGGDLFYRVELEPGDTLEARMEQLGGETGMLYLLDSCDLVNLTCVAGDMTGDDNVASISFDSNADQTVYLGVDSTRASDIKTFSLVIDRIPGD
ncbi:MAG: hypothetical protein ACOCV2_02095 [Persicimonas sp.]